MTKPRVVRTYNQVWTIEKVLYGIQDIPLPIPLTYRQIGFFGTGIAVIWTLNHFPPLSLIDLDAIEYIFLPGLFSWFFTKKKLDGKAPHRFILRAALFYFQNKKHNRYQDIGDSDKKTFKYSSVVAYRKLSRYEREGREEN
jgi:hypothetical protein